MNSNTYFSKNIRRVFQQPTQYTEGLRSRPWWPAEEFESVQALEHEFSSIRTEFENLVLSGRLKFHPQSPGGPRKTVATGAWKIFELFSSGRKNLENACEAPITTRVLERFEEVTSHPLGLVYFSVIGGGVHITPHCGPTNTRLRIHMGLSVPKEAWIRVGAELSPWTNGKCIVFDDSWEHEVKNESHLSRGVLIVDVWHPDVGKDMRQKMIAEKKPRPSKQNMQRGGWIKT